MNRLRGTARNTYALSRIFKPVVHTYDNHVANQTFIEHTHDLPDADPA